MRTLKLKKENLDIFLSKISKLGELWGPTRKGEVYIYDKIDDIKDLIKEPVTTFLPIKKLFLPPRFQMFHYDGKTYEENTEIFQQRIVYGVPSCEIHSLLIFDRVFGLTYKDPYYFKRREQTTIIALSCLPRESCFCKSTNTHVIEEGFDLAMTDLNDYYLVWVGTSKGDDLIRSAPELFDRNVTQEDIREFIEWRERRNNEFNQTIDFVAIPDLMDLNYNSPIWEEFAEKCLSCGACSMVCPTCNCFDVIDEIELSDGSVKRERYWDSCMFKEYSMVAGGHNFREAKAERLKLWYTHKLHSFTGAYGKPSCVGCGRCIITCPVDINILSVAKALLTGKVDKNSLLTRKSK
jgi:sulfhydrogenase subunit beta (sulfur reductase)